MMCAVRTYLHEYMLLQEFMQRYESLAIFADLVVNKGYNEDCPSTPRKVF